MQTSARIGSRFHGISRTSPIDPGASSSLIRLYLKNPIRRGVLMAALCAPIAAFGQAGPPFLTNDPGTPGNGNWEINLAAAQTTVRGAGSYQIPQIDLNYGLGDRVQLTYQVPYLVQRTDGEPRHSGWSNALPGIKWRFLDQGEAGWQLSIFPQIETASSSRDQHRGVGAPGPRLLVPMQAHTKVGPIDVDFEAGYYFPRHGAQEEIFGFAAGRSFNERLELDAELYDDHVIGVQSRELLLDLGGRYKLSPAFLVLFMAGRSVSGTGGGQPEFNGYFGIQILLRHYGRTLASDP
jgi:Putative MetA-pathway of phenol degradation